MISEIRDFIQRVEKIGIARSPENIERRLLKMIEELGELTEAHLNVTCELNYKKKTVQDIREEAIDCLIVMSDIALTRLPYSHHVPSMLLPQIIEEGRHMTICIDLFGPTIMAACKAVTRAYDAMSNRNDMAFYGALANGLRLLSSIVFSPMAEGENIETLFSQLSSEKCQKWVSFLIRKEGVALDEAA